MFSGELIGIAFIVMMFPIYLTEWLIERRKIKIAVPIFCIMLVAGIYCFAAGLHMVTGWEDPLASVDPEEVAQSTHGRRGGGIIIFMIRFWPYILIGVGGITVLHNTVRIWEYRRDAKFAKEG